MDLLNDKWFEPVEIPQHKRKVEATANQLLKEKKTRRGKKKRKKKKLVIPKMSYHVYITSSYWKRRKKQFYATHGKKCSVCGSKTNIQLHHKSYKHHYGKEPDHTLVALCAFHHHKFHECYGVDKNMIKHTDRFVEEARLITKQLQDSGIDDLSWIK